jgi:hypothetical protein
MKKLLFFGLIFSLFACNPKPDSVEPLPVSDDRTVGIEMQYVFDTQPLLMSQISNNTGQNTIGFSNIQHYLSDLKLKKADGSWIAVKGYGLLSPSSNSKASFAFQGVPKGIYEGIRFTIGVDSITNHSDPSIWPNSHALSIMTGGSMHWTWNSGYIFIKVEGQYDIPGSTPGGFAFHLGRDDLNVSYTQEGINLNLQENGITAVFKMDLKQFFIQPNAFTISPETSFTHSGPRDTIAEQLYENMQNMVTFIELKP